MASSKKLRKTDKKRHFGRGGAWLKDKAPGIKGVSFYNASQRRRDKRVDLDLNS